MLFLRVNAQYGSLPSYFAYSLIIRPLREQEKGGADYPYIQLYCAHYLQAQDGQEIARFPLEYCVHTCSSDEREDDDVERLDLQDRPISWLVN